MELILIEIIIWIAAPDEILLEHFEQILRVIEEIFNTKESL